MGPPTGTSERRDPCLRMDGVTAFAGPSSRCMEQRAHLMLMVGLQASGFFTGFLLFVAGYRCTDLIAPPLQMALFVAIGLLAPRIIFRHFVPARCRRCGAPSYPTGMQPIIYRCTVCTHESDSNVSERFGCNGS